LNQRTLSYAIPGSAQLSRHTGAGLTAVGALASFAAILAAASCCVLPLALAALGVGAGLSSSFAALMPLRWPLTVLSITGLAAGWWVYSRRRRACAADRSCTVPLPAKATPVALTIGTVLTIAAVLWDKLEAPLIRALS
jgi:mercuric ion transport protein